LQIKSGFIVAGVSAKTIRLQYCGEFRLVEGQEPVGCWNVLESFGDRVAKTTLVTPTLQAAGIRFEQETSKNQQFIVGKIYEFRASI
jgi:hypothetical protein